MNWIVTLLFFGLAWLAVFVEAAWDAPRFLLGAQIDLLPGLIVYAALTFSLPVALAAGVILGLMFDSVSANPPGVTSVALLAVVFAIFHRRELILRDQFFAQIVLGAAASAAAPLISIIVLLGIGEQPLLAWSTLWQWLIMTAGGALFTPLWFILFQKLDSALRYREIPESSFRPDREIARGRF